MGARREQAQRRRDELIEAALTVFAAQGIDGSSVKDIARAAGVTPGLLYHYFESKEALAAAVLAERSFLPQMHDMLGEHADLPASVVLPRLMRAFDEKLCANADLVALFLSSHHAEPALRELVATGKRRLRSYLMSRAEAGELRSDLIEAASATLFAAVAMGHKTGQHVDVDELVELVLAGLTA